MTLNNFGHWVTSAAVAAATTNRLFVAFAAQIKIVTNQTFVSFARKITLHTVVATDT